MLQDSSARALAQIGLQDNDTLVDKVFDRAVDYSKERAAEMVGKKWVDGKLVDNPNAIWRIDDATRDEIKGIIASGLNDNIGRDAIADNIEEAGAFSKERAALIANTEIGHANSQGALQGYKAGRDIGVNLKKYWIPDENACPICEENGDAGLIDLDDDFPSGDDAPLAHPNCECVLSAEVADDDSEKSSDDASDDASDDSKDDNTEETPTEDNDAG